MSSHQFPGHGISSEGMSCGHHSTADTIAEWLGYPVKLELSDSPSSPLSCKFFERDMAALSSSRELRDSAEAHSQRSLSHNSSLDTVNSSLSNSPIFVPELLQKHPRGTGTVSSPIDKHALQEIETILMSPDMEEATTTAYHVPNVVGQPGFPKCRLRSWEHESFMQDTLLQQQYLSNRCQRTSLSPRPEKRLRESVDLPRGDVRGLLIRCAETISENRLSEFEVLAKETEAMVSISGDPIQRLGAYMLEGLKARREASGNAIYRSLQCREPESSAMLSYMQILYDICPYFKFGYMAANGAIAEAVRNEDHIHIIDFQIAQGTQWLTLIQALAARPGGPPRLRITAIDDPVSKYTRGDSLQDVGRKLVALAEKFNIPLEFNAMPVYAAEVTRDMLEIRPGEAIAVNFTLQLHHTPDESVDVNNPRDGLLRMVKGLSPKVTTLVEQESNTNTAPFLTRFMEALDYYYAMFESIDETLPRDHRDRINVEQHCLAKDIVNIIACEGKERVERHELLGKWRSRLSMAGFKQSPLSSYINSVIRSLLRCYSDKYSLVEKDGAMLLGWKNRHLISASAWH